MKQLQQHFYFTNDKEVDTQGLDTLKSSEHLGKGKLTQINLSFLDLRYVHVIQTPVVHRLLSQAHMSRVLDSVVDKFHQVSATNN